MASTEFARLLAPLEMVGGIARATCAQCGIHADWNLDRRPPPKIIHKHFAERGWILRRPICPTCAAQKRSKPAVSTKTPQVQSPASKAIEAALARPTDAAKRVKRQIYIVLEDAYDDTVKRYRPGWDDARVAKETGASPEFVRKTREEDYGPISAPTEIEALQQRADDAVRLANEALQTASRVRDDVAALYRRNGWS